MQAAVKRINDATPYWFVEGYDATYAEGTHQQLYDVTTSRARHGPENAVPGHREIPRCAGLSRRGPALHPQPRVRAGSRSTGCRERRATSRFVDRS